MSIPTITTPRLLLRPFTNEDIDPLHHILCQEGVLRYFPNTAPPARDRVRKFISSQIDHWETYDYGLWAVEARSNGELMGRSGLQYLPETKETEVDYILGKSFWGQGFATEAAQASLTYGFETLAVERIIGIVHPENKASQRVLEKSGMRFIEEARYFGMDCYRYVIKRSSVPG